MFIKGSTGQVGLKSAGNVAFFNELSHRCMTPSLCKAIYLPINVTALSVAMWQLWFSSSTVPLYCFKCSFLKTFYPSCFRASSKDWYFIVWVKGQVLRDIRLHHPNDHSPWWCQIWKLKRSFPQSTGTAPPLSPLPWVSSQPTPVGSVTGHWVAPGEAIPRRDARVGSGAPAPSRLPTMTGFLTTLQAWASKAVRDTHPFFPKKCESGRTPLHQMWLNSGFLPFPYHLLEYLRRWMFPVLVSANCYSSVLKDS